jgi:hypothetical protein
MITRCKPCRTPVAAPELRAAASVLPPGCLSATDEMRGIAVATAAAPDGCLPADSAAMCIILQVAEQRQLQKPWRVAVTLTATTQGKGHNISRHMLVTRVRYTVLPPSPAPAAFLLAAQHPQPLVALCSQHDSERRVGSRSTAY